jgi:hypothetical protein
VSMKRNIIVILWIVSGLAGCATPNAKYSLTVLECLPQIERRQPYKGTDDFMANIWETDLILAASNGLYRILWAQGEEPHPITLNTNQNYSFVIDQRPDWRLSGYLHCPGGAVPAGFLREIRENGNTIWRDTFYKGVGCY